MGKIKECKDRVKGRCRILDMHCSFLPTLDRKACPVPNKAPVKKEPIKRKGKRLTL
jgi:hypothetical protein